jgi:hypothetical protein
VKRNGTKRYICETKRTETDQNNNVPKPWLEFVTGREKKLGKFTTFLKLNRFVFRLSEKTVSAENTEVLKTVFFVTFSVQSYII